MALPENDYIQNFENKEGLNTSIATSNKSEKISVDDTFDVTQFDKNIEKSFQDDFFSDFKVGYIDGTATKAQLQTRFNNRLDSKYEELDEFKDDEIAKNVIGSIKFELQNLSTLTELKLMEEEILNNENGVETSNRVGLETPNITWIPRNGVDKNNIVNKLKEITDNDTFNKMADFLKKGEVEKFQLEMLDVLNPKENSGHRAKDTWAKFKTALNIGPLIKYGADGLFGNETMSALEDYVEAVNKDEVDGAATAANNTANGVTGNTANKTPGNVPSGNSGKPKNNSEATENTINYKMTDKYEVKKDETVELASNVTSNKRKVYPPTDPLKIKLENNKLIYTGKTVGNHNFTLKIRDENGNMKEKNMTVDVSASEKDVKKKKEKNKKYEGYKESLTSADISKIKGDIIKLGKDYQGVGKEIEVLNKAKPVNKELIAEKKKEQGEIISLFKLFLKREAEISLKMYFEPNNEGMLASKLNAGCTYYFDGKYLSEKKFIRKLRKGKIEVQDINIADLDVSLDASGSSERDKINKYLLGVGSNNNQRNWSIKKLLLTDDMSLVKKSYSRNVETQYKADSLGTLKSKTNGGKRMAINSILGTKGPFGLVGSDKQQSGYNKNYDVGYESEGLFSKERRKLRKLKGVLLSIEEKDLSEAFEIASAVKNQSDIDRLKNQGVDRKIRKLGELYLLSRNIQEPMPQLAEALDRLYARIVLGKFTDFEKIYEKENIGTMKGLIDPDKKRKAIRKLFNGEYFNGLKSLDGKASLDFDMTPKLRELKKIIKKIDLVDFFDGKSRKNRKYEKFDKLYGVYQTSLADNTNIDKFGNPVVIEGNDSYNAVFDFLVGIGEGRQDIVESVNSMKISQNIKGITVGKKEYWYGGRTIVEGPNADSVKKYEWTEINSNSEAGKSAKQEKRFLLQLADYNSDARADFADGGLRMGLQIKNTYKDVKLDQMSGISSNGKPAWQNIIGFAKEWFQRTGKTSLFADLTRLGNGDTDPITLEEINAEIVRNPGLLNALQEMLANSPISVEYIYRYGNKAAEEYLTNPATDLLSNILDGKIEIDGAEQLLDKEIQNLAAQGLQKEKIPELKSVLRPMLYGALIKAGGITTGAAGIGLALDTKKTGTFSLNLGYTDMPGNGDGPLSGTLGVMMSWGDDWKVGQNTTGNAGVGVGTIGFVPVVAGSIGIRALMNPSKITNDTLDPNSAKHFKANAHLAVVGGILTYGAGVGVSVDKMEGINSKYNEVKQLLSSNTGIINNVLNNVTWSGSKDDIILEIKDQIIDKFYEGGNNKSKRKDSLLVINKAAENMYRGLSYYNLVERETGDGLTAVEKATIIHDMAENYALQWRNHAVKSTVGDVHVTEATVGVSFLAGFMPIPYANITVSDYKNLYYTETQKSVADYYAQLSTGVGMERVEDARFYDQNGITPYAVSYLNAKMSIAHPGIETPDLDIKLNYDISNDAPVWNQIDNQVPQALCIPLDMYKYANINISSDMENYVNITEYKNGDGDNVKYLVVPINSKISLLSRSGGNAGKFNLIIGDTKAELDDIQLDRNMGVGDLNGNTAEFNDGMNAQYMDVDKVNTQIDRLRDLSLSVGGNSPIAIENPLDSCENDVNGNLVFNLIDGVGGKCEDMGGDNSDLRIDVTNNKMIMPQFGTLTMHYVQPNTGAGKYEMYYSSSPSDGLKINFDAETEDFANQSVETEGGVQREVVKTDFGSVNIFDNISKDVDDLFSDPAFVEKLQKIDDTKKAKYDEFLDQASEDIDSNDGESYIDIGEYDAAAEILKGMLGNGSEYSAIVAILNGSNPERKSLVINRLKGIMAYNAKITDGDSLKDIKTNHKNVYQTLSGPDQKNPIGKSLDSYRNSVFDELIATGDETLKRDHVEDNLFGYTAFYRAGAKEGRNFSMTAPGDTKVLGGVKEKIGNDANGTAAKEWFMENFKLNFVTQGVIMKSIISELRRTGSVDEDVTNYIYLNLTKLLTKGGKRLDIPGEKYKIKLDLDYYFYLLGECANESIGIKLGGLTVKKLRTTEPIHSGDEDHTGTKIDASSSGGLSVNHIGVLMNTNASEKSAVIGVAAMIEEPGAGTGESGGQGGGDGEGGGQGGGDGEGGGQGGGDIYPKEEIIPVKRTR